MEQDGAVDAGGIVLVQGGVVDGGGVEGAGRGLEQDAEPARGVAEAADGSAAGALAQVGGGGGRRALCFAVSRSPMRASACSGSVVVRPS